MSSTPCKVNYFNISPTTSKGACLPVRLLRLSTLGMDGDPGLLTGEAPDTASRSLLSNLSLLSDAPDPRYEKIQQKRYNIDNTNT